MKSDDDSPSREELMKEYELARASATALEATIWQASAALGVGLAATMIVAMLKPPADTPGWPILAVVLASVSLLAWVWWRMARRWWSIQQALFLRMRHIEARLGLHATRYLRYLDELSECGRSDALTSSGLDNGEVNEIRARADKRVSPRMRDHQRSGVQGPLMAALILIGLLWTIYVILYALGVIPAA